MAYSGIYIVIIFGAITNVASVDNIILKGYISFPEQDKQKISCNLGGFYRL